MTPQGLLEVGSGLDMMKNLSVQTAIQKKLAQYYGQDAQRVTAR